MRFFNSTVVKKTLLLLAILLLTVAVCLGLLWVFYSLFLTLESSPNAESTITKSTTILFFLKLTGVLAFMLIGITMITGALRSLLISFYKSASFWEIHTKWTSSLGIGMATSHLILFLFYQNRLNIALKIGTFLPTTTALKANSNLIFIALLALITVTTNTIITHVPGITGKKWWRPLHILNYLAIVFILLHAFYLGSDSKSGYFRFLYISFLFFVVLGMVYRIVKVFTKRLRKAPQIVVNPPGKNSPIQQNLTKQITQVQASSTQLPDLAPKLEDRSMYPGGGIEPKK